MIRFVSIVFLLGLFNTSPKETQPTKLNILFIAVDDLRPELGCYGKKHISSPNIDRLAAEGFMFTHTYCNIPVCGASRASLLTGTRPTRNNFIDFDTYADKDLPGNISLPRFLKSKNYYTVSVGKVYHHADDGEDGWSEKPFKEPAKNWRNYVTPESISLARQMPDGSGPAYEEANVSDTAYLDGKHALKAIEYLQKFKDSHQPFFLAVGFVKPHLPFNAPKKYWDMYPYENVELAANPFRAKNAPDAAFHEFGELRGYQGIPKEGPVPDDVARKLRQGYYAATSYVDAQIGKVLDELKITGLDKSTIVILWGDHGFNLQEHGLWAKHCNLNTSLQTPMILKVPGMKGGKEVKQITEFVDIYPTLCDLAGLEKPAHLEGHSVVPLLKKPNSEWNNIAVSKYRNGVSVRNERYLYTEYLNNEGEVYARMLYDHERDPDENNNIAELPEHKDLVAQMSKLLRTNWGKNFWDTK